MSIKNIFSKGDNNSLLQFRFQMQPIRNIDQKNIKADSQKTKKVYDKQANLCSLINVSAIHFFVSYF